MAAFRHICRAHFRFFATPYGYAADASTLRLRLSYAIDFRYRYHAFRAFASFLSFFA